jgi:hypothetical protein
MSRSDIVGILIGQRGKLTPDAAEQGARLFKDVAAQHPQADLHPHVGGFDDDPRGLWEIPEVRAYLCRWAELVGIERADDAEDLRIEINTCAVLAKCGAYEDVDPNIYIPGLED